MNNALKPSTHGLLLAVICVIWASFSPNEVAAQLIATGSENLVNSNTQDNQQRPAAATGQLGSTILAWESENLDGDGFAVAAQQYDAMGSVTVEEFQVNTTTDNDQRFPDVAVADNGRYVITWMSFDQDGDGWGIYYKMYNAAGIAITAETLANVTTTGQQQFPTVTMAAGGTFIISWVSDGEIFARMFDANGIATGSEFLVNAPSTTFETNPDVASDNDGNFAIVWQSTDTTGTVDIDVYARLFDNNGVAAGAEFRLNSTTAESQIEPSIGMDTAGNFAVAWSSFLGDGDGYGIIFRRYDPSGNALSGEAQVNSTSAGDQLHPFMAASADGEYIVTWTSFGQDGARGGIYGQHITSSGVLEGPETAVNTTTAENQIFPVVGFYDGEGTATIVWQDGDRVSSTSVDASNYGLIQRRFKVGTVALAKDITVELDATGNATIQPSDVDDGSTPGATLMLDITNFDCTDLGNNIVNLTATSSNGTTATAQSTVTVIDEIAPTVTTQPFNLILDNQGMATLLVGDVVPSVSDNCTVASVTLAETQFDCSDLGAQSISITATDQSGNETITSAVVTVIDNQAPTAVAQNITVQLDAAGNATINTSQVDAGSTDNCSVTLSLDKTTFSCDQAGQDVPVILTATDPSGNSSTANALVTVEDNTPPVVLAQNIVAILDQDGNAVITPSMVDNGTSDNCGFSLSLNRTNFTCLDVGLNALTLTATDPSGNSSSVNASVTIVDDEVPVALAQDITVQLDAAGNVSIDASQVDAGSSDNCGALLSVSPSTFDCTNIGDNPVLLSVSDAGGNITVTTATVTVEDNLAPAPIAQNITVQLDANGTATISATDIDNGSDDNCDLSLDLDITDFDCTDLGPNTVTLTATDGSGNSASASSTVTVVDNIPPLALAIPVVVALDANGVATIDPNQIDGGSADNCGIVSKTLSVTSFDCSNVGINSVTLTVTDASGNSSSATTNILVVDQEEPNVSATNINISLDGNGVATITPALVDNGSTDNCSLTLSLSQTDFDCDDLGPNTVTLTGTDNSGNTATAMATVFIIDEQQPVAVAQDITIQLDAGGTASYSPGDLDNGSSDNCAITLSASPLTFDCTDIGANTVTLTATDGAGNSHSTTATVTVEDNIAPLTISQDITIQLDANGNAALAAGDVDGGSSDNCSVASLSLSQSSFDCSHIGSNTISLTVTDGSGNSSSASATVTVVDGGAPQAVAQDITISLDQNGVAAIVPQDVDGGSSDVCGVVALAIDNNSFDCNDIGDNTVTLTATDAAGNSSSTTSTVTVVDDIPPTITCQDVTISLDANGQAPANVFVIGALVSRSDNCGVQGGVGVTGPKIYNCDQIGTRSVRIFQNDVNGNVTTCDFNLTVVDELAPTAIAQDITVQLDANGNASITAADIDSGSSDNCSVELSIDKTDFNCADLGANTVTLTATDPSGNTSTTTATVTVQDNVAPVVAAQDITIYLDNDGEAFTTAEDVDNGSSDNCGVANLSLSQTDFDCDAVGDNTVTLTATDAAGNSSSTTATVTVIDDIPPTITCQDVTISLDANGQAPANVFVIGALVSRSDNCGVQGGVGVTGPKIYNCDQIGTRSVRIFQNDVNGNVTTCDFNLTVVDELAPTAIAQDITVQLDANGNASITAADVDNGSSDNCSVELSIDKTGFNCADLGANTVTLTATDPSGNTASTTATVTVQDNVVPVVAAQDITIYLDNDGEAFTTAEDVDNGSSDNCGIANLSLSQTDFDCDEVGDNTVTLTATDAAGNSSSTTATVTVVDDIPPTITCQDVTISLDANGQAPANVFVIGALVSRSDNCGVQGGVGVTGPKIYNCDQIGTRSVRIFQNDVNGNVTTCDFNLTVVDELAPTAIAQDITVQLDANGNASITAADIDNGSADNCSVELSIDKSTFDCTDLGTNTVTLTVTDPSGNASSTTATVTVEDNIAPVVSAQNTTVYLDANGQASITVEDIDNGSTDNCGLSLSIDTSEFDCEDVGENTVTLSAIDIKGNVATAIATVTIVDDVPPVVACQDLTIQLDGSGVAMIKPSDIENGSSDACGIASLSIDKDAFGCADVGANLVTLTAVDNNSNSSTCTATVTVQDNTPPVVVCQDITVALDANGQVEISPSDLDGGSTDNCAIASLTIDKTNFDCDAIGDHIVTLTALDVNGNTSTCTSTVTVIDDTPPEVYCVDVTISLDETGRADYSLRDAFDNSTDNCGIQFIGLAGGGFYDCDDLGQNTVTVIAADFSGNIGVCQATVTVIDDTAPTVVTQDLTVYLDATGNVAISAADVDAGTYDNCDFDLTLDVTSFDCDDLGANTVLLSATDPSGNVASQSATITVMDDISPVALAQDITVQLDAMGSANIVPGMIDAGSFDNCAIATMSIDMSSFDCSNLGSNAVTLTVTDPAGNMHSATASVTVEDLIPPTVIAQDLTVSLDDNGGVTITPGMIDGGSFDNCQFDLALDITAFTCDDLGSNFVKLTATDISGLTSSQTVSVTVIDDLAPIAITADLTVQLDGTGSASITPEQIDGGSTDNCSFSLAAGPTSFDCSNLGTNAVILTVADVAGNVSTAVANVTVEDNIAPLAVANDITIELDAAGSATITPQILDGGSSDNCSIAQMTLDIGSFSCADLGSNTVTLTVTDVAGNTDTESATVTVVDLAGPTVVTSDLTVSLDENGQASITTTMADAGSFDNCSATLDLSLSQNQFTCDDLGVNIVQLTATDGAGNSSTGNLSVTVQDEISPTAVAQDITVALDLTTGVAIVHPDDVDAGSGDNCGIVNKTLSASEFDCSQLGPQDVTLSVSDEQGNVSSATATVTVIIDGEVIPTAVCQDITIALDVDGKAEITAADVDGGSFDICGIKKFKLSKTKFDCKDLGTNTVKLTVENFYKNKSTCTATVTVVDNIAPTITKVPTSPVEYEAKKGCSTKVDFKKLKIKAKDNCGDASLSYSPSSGYFAVSEEPYMITVTATDESGNSSEETFEILVSKKAPKAKIKKLKAKDDLAKIEGDFDTKEVTSLKVNWGDGTGNQALEVKGKKFKGEHHYAMSGTYWVEVYLTDQCGGSHVLRKKVKVKIKDAPPQHLIASEESTRVEVELPRANMELSIYPNPFVSSMTVRFTPETSERIDVSLYSLDGKLIDRLHKGHVEVSRTYEWSFEDTDLISSGLYLLKISGDETDLTRRVIYQKR